MHWNQNQQNRYCTWLELMFYVGYPRSETICLFGYVQNVFQINISRTEQSHRTWIRFFFKRLVMFHVFYINSIIMYKLHYCFAGSVIFFRRDVLRLVLKIGSNRERNPNEDKTKLSFFSVVRLQMRVKGYVKANHNMNSNGESLV